MDYQEYKDTISEDVSSQIEKLRCQPVLFFGSGISRRYFDAPNWIELLQELATNCPLIDKDYAYYAQSCSSPQQIGSIFAEKYREWAWDTGRNQFPSELFDPSVEPDAFLKHAASEILKAKCPNSLDDIDSEFSDEITALQNVKPHAIITTNYDTLLELVFPKHTKIVGQSALKGMPFTVGEIFKIHGSVEDIDQLVLTAEDYEIFHKKRNL